MYNFGFSIIKVLALPPDSENLNINAEMLTRSDQAGTRELEVHIGLIPLTTIASIKWKVWASLNKH